MRTINKKRAEMLAPIFKNPESEEDEEEHLDCQFTVNALASKLLMGTFSCKETEEPCSTADCPFTPQNSKEYPLLTIHPSLRPDFTNLVEAIAENFPDNRLCPECNKELIVKREYGRFIFLQVLIFVPFFWLIKIYLFYLLK